MTDGLAVIERRTTTSRGIVVETERVPITVDQSTEPLAWSYRLWVCPPDGTRIALIDQRGGDVFTHYGHVANLIHESLVMAVERTGWPPTYGTRSPQGC